MWNDAKISMDIYSLVYITEWYITIYEGHSVNTQNDAYRWRSCQFYRASCDSVVEKLGLT